MAAWPPISSRSQPIDNTATNPAGNQTTGNTAPSSSTPTTGSNPSEQAARAEECHPQIILPTMGTIPLEAPEETPQAQSQSSCNNEQTDSHQLDEIPVQLSRETQSPDPDTSTSEQPWSPPMNTPPVSESPRQPPVVIQPVTRRSTRQKQTPNYLQDYICQNATVKTSPHHIEKYGTLRLPLRLLQNDEKLKLGCNTSRKRKEKTRGGRRLESVELNALEENAEMKWRSKGKQLPKAHNCRRNRSK
nr:uncharacterized protein LOC109174480 [Ipomoea trifida]